MAGDMKEFLQNVEGGTINNESEYKKYEKLIKNPQGKEEFKQEVDAKWSQILQSFWEWLDQKIQLARSEKWKMNPDVREAYNVLGKLKDKQAWAPAEQAINGRAWLYNEMKNAAEQEAALDKKYQEMITLIDNNPDWSHNTKVAARNVIKELFAECKTPEEFERRSGTRLDTVNSIDGVKDVIKWSISVVKEIPWIPKKVLFELYRQCWVGMEKLNELWREALKKSVSLTKDFVEWSKEAWQTITDITKTVIQFWDDLFKQYLNYLEEVKEWIEGALNIAWEYCWNKWDAFVNLCWGMRDVVVAFWKKLVEEWKLAVRTFLDSMVNNWEKAKAICIELINEWKIKIGELVEWCKGMAQKWKEMLVSIIESSVAMWNKFADYCKDNWEACKAMFQEVARTLLEKGKMALDDFVERCKWAWETVKDAACAVLVGLEKAWKFTLDVICGTLLVLVGSAVLVWELLVKAWKEIYKKWAELANFVSKIATNMWEKVKDVYKTASEYVWALLKKCKEYGIATAEFVKNFVRSTWESMKAFGLTAKDFIVATYEVVKTSLKGAWDKTAEFFKNLWMTIQDVVVTLYESAKWAWKNCSEFIANAIEKWWLNFKSAISLMIDKCKMGIDMVWRAFVAWKKYVVEFINYAKEKWLITYKHIKEWCKNNVQQIENFIKTAIDKAKATWKDIKEWCGWRIQDIKNVLNNLYWKTKEWVKWLLNFMKEGGMAVLEAGKLMLTLGIGVVALVVIWLKEAWAALADVAKMCVESLVKYWKLAVNKLCDALAEAYWATKEKCIMIWEYVAKRISESAKWVRNWIYEKTRDAKAAYEAMQKYITDWVKQVATWLYKRGVALVDVCKTIKNAFGTSLKTAWEWLKAFAQECRIGISDLLYAAWDWIRS